MICFTPMRLSILTLNNVVSTIAGRIADWHGDSLLFGELTRVASHQIHSELMLVYDCDRLGPTAVRCRLTSTPALATWGCGRTPNEAVCRALIVHVRKRAAHATDAAQCTHPCVRLSADTEEN